MFRPVSLYVGLRYTRAKRRNHFISFISLVSIISIAIGVAVLITVLSVMNGFDHEIRERIFNMASQVSILGYDPPNISNWQTLSKKVNKTPNVIGVAPFVAGQAMLANRGAVQPVVVTGILPDIERSVSTMDKHMLAGSFQKLTKGSHRIVIGQALADNFGLDVGDKVNVIIPEPQVSPLGVIPRYARFTVAGIFHVGGGFKYDQGAVYVSLGDAQVLYRLGKSVSGLRLKVNDLYVAPQVAGQLRKDLSFNFRVTDWTEEFGGFFKAIRMEKTMMFIILILIVAVAVINLISTLVMVVTDKRSEIAILRTIGASPGSILAMFMVQGSLIGIVGTLLGLIGGVSLAKNVTWVVEKLQALLHTRLISESVYFIDYLPSKIEITDVVTVCAIALIMSLLATIYPAWSASRTQPAEALRYE